MSDRIGGIIRVKRNGVQLKAKGSWSYNLGIPKKETVVGADGIHGHKATIQPAFIEGEITDTKDLSLADLASIENETITIELYNGKVIVLPNAVFTGEGTGQTEEGNISVRFEAASAEEVS